MPEDCVYIGQDPRVVVLGWEMLWCLDVSNSRGAGELSHLLASVGAVIASRALNLAPVNMCAAAGGASGVDTHCNPTPTKQHSVEPSRASSLTVSAAGV